MLQPFLQHKSTVVGPVLTAYQPLTVAFGFESSLAGGKSFQIIFASNFLT